MKVTILGCGYAGGVPLIGNRWGNCDPMEPRNRRLRPSILVQEGDTTLLVDTSPDLRQQLLTCGLLDLTAILYTHEHADHTHGIDDLRSVNWLLQRPIAIYAASATLKDLATRFSYIFSKPPQDGKIYKPSLVPHVISGPLQFGSIKVTPFTQNHGPISSLGFRFNDFAYSTDVKLLDEAAFGVLTGVKAWVVDAARETPHPTHSHLAQTLEWIARVKPERAWLTHLDQTMDYRSVLAKCPDGVEPAYDGLEIKL
jgi:phosphoribosyl 1,2-cyclic phosphate phosphodiesterase